MAVVTIKGHVSRAIDFYEKTNIYFCIGRTTPWQNEDSPPVPKNTDDMEEPIGYKVVESKFLVIPVTNDYDPYELTYRDTKWKIVNEEEALDMGARWVYITSYIAYDEFSVDSIYRQIGVYTRLKKKDDIPDSKSALLPEEVTDPGILEILDNRKPIYRELDQREKLAVVIEF